MNGNSILRIIKTAALGAALLLSAPAALGDDAASAKTAAFTKGESLIAQKKFKEAIKFIEGTKKAGEDTAPINLLLAEALSNRVDEVGSLKQLSLAKKIKSSLERVLELSPENMDALSGLAQFHIQAPGVAGGSKDEAKALISKIQEVKPYVGYNLGAMFAMNEKEFDTAIMYADKALAIDPDKFETYIAKGTAYKGKEDFQGAISVFETCFETTSNQTCQYYIGRMAVDGKLESEKGIKALTATLADNEIDGNLRAYSHFRLGQLLERKADKAGAKVQYQKSLAIQNIKGAKKALKALK